MTKDKIKNSEVASFICPAKKDRCPTDMKDINILLDKYDTWYERDYSWKNIEVPTLSAQTWNCKYLIKAKENKNLLGIDFI